MSAEAKFPTTGRAILIVFVGVLLALVTHDLLDGVIEGIRAALAG